MDAKKIVSPSSIRTLWSLNLTTSRSCHTCADMTPTEYGILASIREHDQGIPVRMLREQSEDERLSHYHEERLLDKELIARMRDRIDRRAIAYTVTSKGKKLVDQVDKALALALTGQYPSIGEADFETLVTRLHDFSTARNRNLKSSLLFPSAAIGMLTRLQRISTHETSHASMSLSQLASLCVFELEGGMLHTHDLAKRLTLEPETAEFLLDDMAERGILISEDSDSAYSITQIGLERSRTLRARIGSSLDAATAGFDQNAKTTFDELKRYVAYLFA